MTPTPRTSPDRTGRDRTGLDRTEPRRARLSRAAVAGLLAAAVLLAGCAQIPQSSPVRTAEPLADTQAEPDAPQFRPPGPAGGAQAEEIVRGFIAAGTSPQEDYGIARSYLTDQARTEWVPGQRTVVYSAAPTIVPGAGVGEYEIQVEVQSEVDEFGLRTLAPPGTTQAWEVKVVEDERGVRIASVDDGTLLSSLQFSQLYAPHELFFYDQTFTYAVPDVRWFVNRGTTVSAATRALLHGPAPYLSGAVVTAFPLRSGADLTGPSVPVDEAGVAHVDLTEATMEGADAPARFRMQEQLDLTLTGLSSVSKVEISVGSAPLSVPPQDQAPQAVAVDPAAGSVQVGVDPSNHGLVFFQGLSVTPVGGVPDVSGLHPQDPAMSRDRTVFVFLGSTRTSMHVATTEGQLRLVLEGESLTAPSLDALGWAWTVDVGRDSRISAHPVRGGGTTRVVTAPWLAEGETIVAMRVSRGGARAALVVDDGERRSVRVAGVVRGSDGVPASLTDPILVPSPEDVAQVEWAGDTGLVVTALAENTTDRVAPQLVSLDGTSRALNPLTGLTRISTGDDGTLYAETDAAVFLLVGSSWRAQELESPVRDLAYPG